MRHYLQEAQLYDKNAETEAANAAITDMQMRQRDVAVDAKAEELARCYSENDALRDDVAAGRRRLHIKAVCQSVREATASGVDSTASPRLANTAERVISPRERLITMQKQLEGTQKYVNERWSPICPYRCDAHAIIVSNTHALQRV